jgi:DNA-binding NarL/FixJ family response regulator
MGSRIRVLIADDQALIRASFRLLVETEPDMKVVAEAATGQAAVIEAGRTLPDVALMDVRMPVMDGLEATRRIRADPRTSRVAVLVLTTFDLDEYVYAALRAGASGFLLKDVPPPALLDGIRIVAAGDALLAPSVTRRLIAEFAHGSPTPATPLPPDLTEREREVLALIGRGLSNGEIAAALGVTVATVKTHVGHLLGKTAARDRVQLVIRAYESGLVG